MPELAPQEAVGHSEHDCAGPDAEDDRVDGLLGHVATRRYTAAKRDHIGPLCNGVETRQP
jgi:hypothetical protein